MNLQKKQKANWAKKFTEIVAAASTTATGQKIWIIIVKFYFKLESLRKEFVFFLPKIDTFFTNMTAYKIKRLYLLYTLRYQMTTFIAKIYHTPN